MGIRFTSEQEAQLHQLAASTGGNAEQVVEETVRQMPERQARFSEAVKLGEAELDRGEYLTHEEVGVRIDKNLISRCF